MLTVGHGTASTEEFLALLAAAGVELLVDVRSFPGSRRNPQFGRDVMAGWLPAAGIDYRRVAALGGRRRPKPDSQHVALRNESFRAYADHMQSPLFAGGVEELLGLGTQQRLAFMCSETVWWRCHRRLLADHLTLLRSQEVLHLLHDSRLTPHPPTRGVRVDGDTLIYDDLAASSA